MIEQILGVVDISCFFGFSLRVLFVLRNNRPHAGAGLETNVRHFSIFRGVGQWDLVAYSLLISAQNRSLRVKG
jgi:hypothetical protein